MSTEQYTINPAELLAHLEAKGLVLAKQGQLLADGHQQSNPLGIVRDSRKAGSGTLFCAYQGVAVDSHKFLPEVIAAGTPVVIHDAPFKLPAEHSSSCLAIKVSDARAAWAEVWSYACGKPGDALTMIGITGTNGKSSVTWMIHQLLSAAGHKGILLGTLGATLAGEDIPLQHTTPDPEVLYPLLAKAVAAGCSFGVMEVASHALAQGKLAPLCFAYAGFTSFSRDHLDLHGTLAEYFAIKALLFGRHAPTDGAGGQQGFVHSSVAPRLSRQLTELQKNRIAVYGSGFSSGFSSGPSTGSSADFGPSGEFGGAAIGYSHSGLSFAGTQLTVTLGANELLADVPVRLVTEFQLANLTLALAIAHAIAPSEDWAAHVADAQLEVPGRMQSVVADSDQQPLVVIDYSHTPDAVSKALQALRQLKAERLTVIVGCGGDRDPGKRPLMAKAALSGADRVVFTTDNPRTEAPLAILADMTEGLDLTKDHIDVVVDRKEAIRMAVQRADGSEVILLAGKGHESYQEIHGERLPFDEVALVQDAFCASKER